MEAVNCDNGAETNDCKLEDGDTRAGEGVSALHVSGGECSKERASELRSVPSYEVGWSAEWVPDVGFVFCSLATRPAIHAAVPGVSLAVSRRELVVLSD